jgi:hypothetical protein
MKSLTWILPACLVAVLTLASSEGASYVTNFNPPAYVGNSTLSGQDGGTGVYWDTNNYSPGLGQSDFVGVIPGYSTSGSDYWAFLGGAQNIAPVVDTSYLFRPLDLTGSSSLAFNVKFGITSSVSPQTNKDTFGWTFRDAMGNQILRVGFIPDINQPNNLTIRVYDKFNNELAGSGAFNIFNDAKYDLSVNLSAASTVSVSVKDSIGNPATQIINNQFAAGALSSLVGDIAATWTLADTTAAPNGERPNYGGNALVFDNYAVTVPASVPDSGNTFIRLASVVAGMALIASRRRASA